MHRATGYNQATGTAPLMLGSTIDIENNGAPTAGANGDDLAGSDDEDGVAAPITRIVGQAGGVVVSATNNTTSAATLAGWIDVNGNGTFETAERVMVPVPASCGTAKYTLTFPAGTFIGNTYARFRLFPGTVAAPLPTGAATAGEVEDYPVTATAPVVTCADRRRAVQHGLQRHRRKSCPSESRDSNWDSGLGTADRPASATSWIDAFVVAPVAGAWTPSPFGNASWISYFANANQGAGNVDVYFRYQFTIAPDRAARRLRRCRWTSTLTTRCPRSGSTASRRARFQPSLPQSTANTYFHTGFRRRRPGVASLSHGFQHGPNRSWCGSPVGLPSSGSWPR